MSKYNLGHGLLDVHRPVELLDLLVEGVLDHLARFKHKDGSPEISEALLGDPGGQLLGKDAALLLGHGGDQAGHLYNARHRDLKTGITLEVELLRSMTRQVAMYFSILLRRAC